jgi:hypothetical protein
VIRREALRYGARLAWCCWSHWRWRIRGLPPLQTWWSQGPCVDPRRLGVRPTGLRGVRAERWRCRRPHPEVRLASPTGFSRTKAHRASSRSRGGGWGIGGFTACSYRPHPQTGRKISSRGDQIFDSRRLDDPRFRSLEPALVRRGRGQIIWRKFGCAPQCTPVHPGAPKDSSATKIAPKKRLSRWRPAA